MMKDYLDKSTQSFSGFMFVFLGICVFILATTTALWADESESQTASAGATRAWSDLAPEVRAGIAASAEEQGVVHPLLYDISKDELEWLKRQPYTPSADEYLVTNEEDTSVTGLAPEAKVPTISTNFEGMDVDDQPAGISRPPDPHAAVGPSHIVTVVNTSLAVYDKTGTQLNSASFADWWANVYTTSNPFDPRIVYDHNEGHWIMMALGKSGSTTSKFLISVSKTNDPTGDWWNWALEGALTVGGLNTWADYPDVGFDGTSSSAGGAIYITANQFTFSSPYIFKTSVLLILPKSSLYAGTAPTYWRAWDRTDGDGGQAFTLRTAVTFGTPGAEYLVNTAGDGIVTLWKVIPTFPGTAVNWTRQASISIGSYITPSSATQLGCGYALDTLNTRMYNSVYRGGAVYCAFCEGYDWGSGMVAAIRYLKLDTVANTADLNIRYGVDGYFYWMPAICPDASKNIVLVFARSNSSEYAGLRAAYREFGASSTSSSILIQAGEECITGLRWGDYFSAALDPSDTNLVWVYGEYAKNVSGVSSVWDWGTRVAAVNFGAPTPKKSDLVGDWPPNGVWGYYNDTNWTRISSSSPDGKMVTGDLDGDGRADVIGDWSGTQAYMNNSSWKQITSASPGSGGMVTGDLDGNGKADLILDLGSSGTQAYMNNSSWKQITSARPGAGGMAAGDLDGNGKADLIGDWSGSTWAYMNDTNWKRITSERPGAGGMVTGDLDGNGKADLIGDWNGTWCYYNNATWTRLTPASPGSGGWTTGDLDGDGQADLIGDWNGTWAYMNNSTWTRLSSTSPWSDTLTTGDLDGDGNADLIGDWSGTWAYMNNTSWKRITTGRPGTGGLVTGDLDGQ